MADDNRFFRYLWRFNAILLACVGLGAIALVGYVLSDFGQRYVANPVAAVVTVGHGGGTKSGSDEDQYEFVTNFSNGVVSDTLTSLEGTHEAIMTLQRRAAAGSATGSLSGRTDVDQNINMLVIDLDTAKTRWMFHGVKRSILMTTRIHKAGDESPLAGLLMAVADSDTNGDGNIDGADDHSLFLYRPGQDRAEKLLVARGVSNIVQIGERVAVTYNDGKNDRITILSLPGFRSVADNVIPWKPD